MLADTFEREERKRKFQREQQEKELAEAQQANMIGSDDSGKKEGQVSAERPAKSHRKFEEFWEDQVRQEQKRV
jgi:hypothetical protein